MRFEELLKKKTVEKGEWQPRIFDASRSDEKAALVKLLRSGAVVQVSDYYEDQLKELFEVNNPTKIFNAEFNAEFKKYLDGFSKKRPLHEQGRWVYYPWLSTLVHVLTESDFFRVRTARNRYLITEKEQKKFYNARVSIAGLSVGNSVALALVLQGGAKHMTLADYDTLALSNTNRIRVGVESIGLPKVVMTARQIYAINPYAKVTIMTRGLSQKTIPQFFKKCDVVIDELDNLAVKYLIRLEARKRKLPVVMAADNGDNAVVDIERYDLRSMLSFFHGRMGKVNYEMLLKLDKMGIGRMITKHVGAENVAQRMQESLPEIGKTIVSWPQLGGAALLNGSAVAYCVRKIVNGEKLEGNRALISLDEKLVPRFMSAREHAKRTQRAKKFKALFGV